MVFYGIVIAAVVLFLFWLLRTPLFRAHRGRGSKDIGQSGRGPESWWQ
jgi:hypothetical protein